MNKDDVMLYIDENLITSGKLNSAALRWGKADYIKVGFELKNVVSPNGWYFCDNILYNERDALTKDINLNEHKIFDCGFYNFKKFVSHNLCSKDIYLAE
jgi:hypothetical protein